MWYNKLRKRKEFMGINHRCPKCGSTKVQLSNERNKHGFLWLILFGIYYAFWWICKATAALVVLMCFDWWFAIVKKSQGKGYVWLSKRIIQNKSKIYFCHNCGNNFRA